MSKLPDVEQHYSAELVRKAIHLCSLSIPVVYYFIPRETALTILVPLTAAFLITDVLRFTHPSVRALFHRAFGWLLRSHERNHKLKRLNGATYVLLSACIMVWLFPKVIVVTAFAILIISDTTAALAGRKFGTRKFLRKSLEGTTAFFVSALIVVALAPKIEYLMLEYVIGGIGALVGAVTEASPLNLDDNLSIPLVVGGTMWVLYLLLLPSVDISSLDAIH